VLCVVLCVMLCVVLRVVLRVVCVVCVVCVVSVVCGVCANNKHKPLTKHANCLYRWRVGREYARDSEFI